MKAVDYQNSTATSKDSHASWRLGHILDLVVATAPNSTAIIVGAERRRISYAGLAKLVTGQCTALRRSGLQRGDVIALQSTNSLEFVVGLLAAARAGVVVAPLNPALPSADRRERVDQLGARVILTDADDPAADTSAVDCPEWYLRTTFPNDLQEHPVMRLTAPASARAAGAPLPGLTRRDALIMFTSGTTGTPKLVPWTHDNLAAAIASVAGAYQLVRDDATVAAMPLFHGHGLIATLLATLSTGGAVVLPAARGFSAHTFWDDVAAVDATWYTAVPTIHQILLQRAAVDLPDGYHPRLRFIRSCSAPLSPATARRMEATLHAPILAAYGMTETTHQASSVLPISDDHTRFNTVGTPTELSVRIVDGEGRTCPRGAIGEIWLRGPTVVRGYLDNPDATASTFVDGWVRSGDLGAVDADGTLTVRGRIKELINRGGEKISPQHVEEILMSHPGVAQAAVFGIPDPLYGERVAALIQPEKGFHVDSTDLLSYCRHILASFEIPERIAVADQLPLNGKGAVDRSHLAEILAGAPPL
jgi:acyl-CoA synthetase (AMP-forming)/AMP-acid ligase II